MVVSSNIDIVDRHGSMVVQRASDTEELVGSQGVIAGGNRWFNGKSLYSGCSHIRREEVWRTARSWLGLTTSIYWMRQIYVIESKFMWFLLSEQDEM